MAITLSPDSLTSAPAAVETGNMDFTAGIPLSSAPPDLMPDANPWDLQQQASDQADNQWRSRAIEQIDSVALNPDGYFKDKPLDFTRDPEHAKRLALNSAFLEFSTDGPVPFAESDIQRKLLRQEVAIRQFNGRGAESEEAFHAEIVKSAQGRRDERAIFSGIAGAAADDGFLPVQNRRGMAAVIAEAKAKPGFDTTRQADYAEAYAEASRAIADKIEPFRETLDFTWMAAKNKALIPREKLSEISDGDWPEFLSALRLRAETLPDTEKETFLSGMRKDLMRSLESFGRQAGEAFISAGLEAPIYPGLAGAGPVENPAAQSMREDNKAEFARQRNRAHEVRRILDSKFDVINYVDGLGWLQKAPGVTVTSLSMAVPVIGPSVMMANMSGASQESLYLKFRNQGLSETDAGEFSGALAPAVAIPQAALEKVGFGIISRKLPGISKALTAVGDKITNRALRLGVTGGLITAGETTTEVLQDFTESVVQDIAHEIQPMVPDVDLSKEFTGAWAQAPEIAGSMIFLSLFGAAGGLSREAQAAAWAQSTPLQRAALGITPEASAAIDAAAKLGPSSLTAAVDDAWQTRDPNSETAKAAVDELKAQQASQARAAADLERLGYATPRFIQTADGISVVDSVTGEEIGQAPDLSGAIRIARTHTVAMDDMEADQVAALGSLMEAARAAAELDPNAAVDVGFDETFDPEKASPEMAARFAAQVALKEQAEGGTGDIARSVLGTSETTFAQGLRTTVNRIYRGGSVLTVFHETFHGLRRQAHAAGTITRADEIALLRGLDQVLATRKAADGTALRFIPEGMAEDQISDTLLDEAISEIAEMEVLRLRKGTGKGKLGVSRGVVSRNLSALARLIPGVAGKFSAFLRAVRAHWGLSLSRAVALKAAERRGEYDAAGYDSFLNKLLGLDAQQAHDDGVRAELNRIMGLPEFDPTDEIPFSIGRADTTVFSEASKPMNDVRPAIGAFGREIGMTSGNGWNAARGMSNNAARAIDDGKMPMPEFKVWLAETLGVANVPEIAIRRGNDAAGNFFREYHHMGKNRAAVGFYNPAEIEKSPKFFLGMAGYFDMLKTGKKQAAASRKQALQAWKNLKQALIEDGRMGDWKGSETKSVRNQSARMEVLPDSYRAAVSDGRMTLPEAEIKAFTEATAALEKEAATLKAAVDKRQAQISKWTKKIEAGEKPPYDGYLVGQEDGLKSDAEKLAAVVEQLQKRTPAESADAGRKMDESRASSLSGFESRQSLEPKDGSGMGMDASAFSIGKDRPENKVDPKKAFASAIEKFGLTNDITEAGYVLPDGKLLDFTGRAQAGFKRVGDRYVTGDGSRDWMKGQRGVDHREIEWDGMPDYRETWMPMVEFMAMGAVRVDRSGAITIHGRQGITSAQKSRLSDLLIESGGEAYLDMEDDDGKRAAIGFSNGKIGKLAGFIQRWKEGWTPDDYIQVFSIGPADVPAIMEKNALSRIQDPRRRTQAMQRIARDFNSMRLQIDRLLALSGRKRSKAELRQEANAREDLRAEELIADVHRRFGSILLDEDLTKIKSQPVHAWLADPDTPLRGRLMSKAAAIKAHPERYALHRGGEYDGSEAVSRSVFGGQNMPDQMAQELFDHGLISEPTPDAMWEALLSEQNTVARNKEFLAKAMEQIREAKAEAKREATEWLQTQGKDQETNFNPREDILRSLRMLDAILLAMPPEVRGKVGGYTQMARITTDEAKLSFLKDKLAKADKELEIFLRAEFGKEFEDLMKRARPSKDAPGERPSGNIDPDAWEIFKIADAATHWKFVDAEAEATKWDSKADNEDTTPEDSVKFRAIAQVIRLCQNWEGADAARREAAVKELEGIFYGGLDKLRRTISARAERVGMLRDSARIGTGKRGSRMEREAAKKQAGKLAWEIMSFGQVVNVLFGENSAAARWMNAREIAASNALEDSMQVKANALESLFETLAGSRFAGEKLRHRMQTEKSITVSDALGEKQTFTESEAITFLLMWRQEDGSRHMRGIEDEAGNIVSEWGWNEASAQEVESQLSPAGQQMLAFLGDSYGEEYDRINDVFRRIWHVSMPRHKMYAPLTVKATQAKADTIMDPTSGDTMGIGMTPGSLKNRSQTAIAEPDFRDAFQVYLTHARQMDHFIAYGEFARDALAVVNRRDTRNAIEAAGGKVAMDTLGRWLDYFAMGGIRDANMGSEWMQTLGRMLGRLSQAALVGRVSVLAMQSLQMAAAAYKMPLGAYLSRFAKLHAGRLGWGDAIRSPYIQRRLAEMPPVVRDAIRGLEAGSPNRLKFYAAQAGRTIAGADALFTAGTYAIFYDYHLKQNGGDVAAAHAEAERLTDQVAQPTRSGARSMIELANSGNPAFRALWNFSSDPRQKASIIVYEMMRRDKKGGEKAAAAGKAIAITWGVSGILQAVLRAVLRDLRSDDDDEIFDERHWNLKRLALQAATGPVGAMPFFGEMIEGATYKATGTFMPGGSLLDSLGDAVGMVPKWMKGDFDLLEDAERLFTGGAVFSGTSGAAASGMHILRDAWGIIDNLTD